MKILLAAAAAACALVGTQSAFAETKREQVSLSIPTEGLDLSNPRDVARLRERMSYAIAKACNPGDRINADVRPDWQCRREMSMRADATVTQLALAATKRNIARN